MTSQITPEFRGKLLISDAETAQMYRWNEPFEREMAISEHAGLLHLPDGDSAFIDEINGQVVGLRDGEIAWTSPCALPAEHLACDPSGRYLVVTSGLGMNTEVWASVVTVLDRGTPDQRRAGKPLRSRRFRTRVGEPGVVVTGGENPQIVLRHREPGGLELIDLSEAMDVRFGVPTVTGRVVTGLPETAHGDLLLPERYTEGDARLLIASDRGVEEWRISAAKPGSRSSHADAQPDAPSDAQSDAVLAQMHPWNADGRGWFLHWAHQLQTALTVVRRGGMDPNAWDTWTNALWVYDPVSNEVSTIDIGDGLVFRLAPVRGGVAVSRVHPDGDEVIVFDVATTASEAPRLSVRHRIALPAMPQGPKRGQSPWEGCTRRAITADPDGSLVAVSSGGEGVVHVLDAEAGQHLDEIKVAAKLNEGSILAWADGRRGDALDTVGR